MSRNLLRNQVSSTLRTQTRGVAGETVAVGAAILGAGKLIGGGLAAAGLIGAGTGIGTVFGALITGKHNQGARYLSSEPSREHSWADMHAHEARRCLVRKNIVLVDLK